MGDSLSERLARVEETVADLRIKVAVIEAKVALYAALGSAVASVVVGFAFRAWG